MALLMGSFYIILSASLSMLNETEVNPCYLKKLNKNPVSWQMTTAC